MVGGTGPESTLVYYRDVIEGVKARRGAESLPMLTVESLSVFNVMSFCANRDYDGLADYLTAGFTNLANAGCEVASLTALTPHIVFDRVAERSRIPLVSAVGATCEAAVAAGVESVVLLGTEFTMREDFFAGPLRAAGLEVALPNDDEITVIQHHIASELEHGVVLDETRAEFVRIIERLRDEAGADQVVLGCTELPLILDDSTSPIPCLDPAQVHIAALVDAILDENDEPSPTAAH
jgi:aspartate racemase